MAFADPQSVNPGSGAVSLPRTGSGITSGAFQANDGTLAMDIQHSYGKRTRRTIGVTLKKYSADPTRPDQNTLVSSTVRLVVDHPVQGFTVAELTTLVTGLVANLTGSSNANIGKLLGGES